MKEKEDKKQNFARFKIFTVPLSIEPIRNNISINTNSNNRTSKEEIIKLAVKFDIEGNILKAAKYYRYCINQGWNDYRVFYNYGKILQSNGNIKKAEIYAQKATELNPNSAIAHYNLGNISRDLGKLEEAQLSFTKAIEKNPHFAKAFLNLGGVLRDLDKLKEAEKITRKAIKLNPTSATSYLNLGSILSDLNNLEEAESFQQKAIELNPNFAIAHYNLGNTLRDLGKLKEAQSAFHKAIKLNPNFVEAYTNMGNILYIMGNMKEAESVQKKAIQLDPNFATAYSNLGDIYKDSAKFNDAIKSYKDSLKLDKNLSSAKLGLITSKANICDWSDQNIQNIWLEKLGIEGSAINPWDLFSIEDNPLKHLKRSRNLYKEIYIRKESKISYKKSKKKKIHVGYFSSDFRAHPTMYLINSILRLHDKSKFKIYLYSFTPKEDEFTNIAKNSGCIFRDIKELNNKEASELAKQDELDIAIDLMGYIKYNRMSIFSYRVAPIQINYLGYPGSVGGKNIDYILADQIIIPKEYEIFYSEKVIRMPNCYQCNDNQKYISKTSISREDYNLPNRGFIFTCFNNNYKITQKEFDIWMRLLKEKKESVLWLYKSNKWSMENLYKEAEKRNIDPKRIIFAKRLPLGEHLNRHTLGDLAIDTFNCNGHTTTSDALWAGLPVLTKLGKSFAARVSASLLTSIGIPELITYNEKEYEEKALYFANNPIELKKVKSKLLQLRDKSSVYNSELFTRDLEIQFNKLIEINN